MDPKPPPPPPESNGERVYAKMKGKFVHPKQLPVTIGWNGKRQVLTRDVIGFFYYKPNVPETKSQEVVLNDIKAKGHSKGTTLKRHAPEFWPKNRPVFEHFLEIGVRLIPFIRKLKAIEKDKNALITEFADFIDTLVPEPEPEPEPEVEVENEGENDTEMEDGEDGEEDDVQIVHVPDQGAEEMDMEEAPVVLSKDAETVLTYIDEEATFEVINKAKDFLVSHLHSINAVNGILGGDKTIRFTRDGTKMAAYDVIRIVCRGGPGYAKKTFKERPQEVQKLFHTYNFGGRGESNVWVGDIRAVLHLIMVLPGKSFWYYTSDLKILIEIVPLALIGHLKYVHIFTFSQRITWMSFSPTFCPFSRPPSQYFPQLADHPAPPPLEWGSVPP